MPGKVSDANSCKIPTNPHHDADVKYNNDDDNASQIILSSNYFKFGYLGHFNVVL